MIQAETQFARLGERIGLYGRPGQEPLNATKYGETSESQAEGAGGVALLHQMMTSLLSERTCRYHRRRKTVDRKLVMVCWTR